MSFYHTWLSAIFMVRPNQFTAPLENRLKWLVRNPRSFSPVRNEKNNREPSSRNFYGGFVSGQPSCFRSCSFTTVRNCRSSIFSVAFRSPRAVAHRQAHTIQRSCDSIFSRQTASENLRPKSIKPFRRLHTYFWTAYQTSFQLRASSFRRFRFLRDL